MHYCFIVNNEPGKAGNAEKIRTDIDKLPEPIDFEIYLTTAQKTAIDHVRDYCKANPEQETCFVACGGDGTINEVATGMVEIDILKVGQDHYSINVCNFGFDSVVASTANKLSRKGNKNPYRWGIVKAIFCGRFNSIQVKADGELLNDGKRMLLCTLGNNNHVGGEFFCSPRAKNDDGLMEVGYCKTTTLAGFLGLLPIYTAGKHLDDPKASRHFVYRQSKTVDVHSDKEIELCLDGEMFAGKDFHIEVIPQAISFIIPN